MVLSSGSDRLLIMFDVYLVQAYAIDELSCSMKSRKIKL